MNVFGSDKTSFRWRIITFVIQGSNAKVDKVTISPASLLEKYNDDEKNRGGDRNGRRLSLANTAYPFGSSNIPSSMIEEESQRSEVEDEISALRRTKSFLTIRDLKKGRNVKMDLNMVLKKKDRGYLMKERKLKILNNNSCNLLFNHAYVYIYVRECRSIRTFYSSILATMPIASVYLYIRILFYPLIRSFLILFIFVLCKPLSLFIERENQQ